MKGKQHQIIPYNWDEREKLREKGQFWTPDWVASAMVSYVAKDSSQIFDPATGNGAFFEAIINTQKKDIRFYGLDIDKAFLSLNIYDNDRCKIEIRDFILNPPNKKFKSIVANPPYIRHHRISKDIKGLLKQLSFKTMGFKIDGRAGYHIYFLIQALNLLEKNGRLAFIMPADSCEGIFSTKLWKWITSKFNLQFVITFDENATPFPSVDTNAVVYLIENSRQEKTISWVRVSEPYTNDLLNFIASNSPKNSFDFLTVFKRSIEESLSTGLSRFPSNNKSIYKLKDFANVMRGVATGANEFFFLTKEQADDLKIPKEFLKTAVGRTRDVPESEITFELLEKLESKLRPTLLFSPDGRSFDKFPISVQNYLNKGIQNGYNKRALIKTRNPWYKMETRKPPSFLFAYLGRRNTRFLKNKINVIPLTGFLCVYPKSDHKIFINKLWHILNHKDTLDNLILVGKSYGSGSIKVEPRSLENLPIPENLIKKYNLLPIREPKTIPLFVDVAKPTPAQPDTKTW